LKSVSSIQSLYELFDGGWLITGRSKIGHHLKAGHMTLLRCDCHNFNYTACPPDVVALAGVYVAVIDASLG
jgi:hypothetical protein